MEVMDHSPHAADVVSMMLQAKPRYCERPEQHNSDHWHKCGPFKLKGPLARWTMPLLPRRWPLPAPSRQAPATKSSDVPRQNSTWQCAQPSWPAGRAPRSRSESSQSRAVQRARPCRRRCAELTSSVARGPLGFLGSTSDCLFTGASYPARWRRAERKNAIHNIAAEGGANHYAELVQHP